MASGAQARLATFLILAVVFGAGLAVGAAVDRQVAAAADAPEKVERPVRIAADSTAPDPEESEEPRERRMMIEQVMLTVDQKVEVDSIVDVMGTLMADLQKDYRTRYWAVVDSTRASLKRTLTPEQAEMYDSLVVENDRRRRSDAVRLPRN